MADGDKQGIYCIQIYVISNIGKTIRTKRIFLFFVGCQKLRDKFGVVYKLNIADTEKKRALFLYT